MIERHHDYILQIPSLAAGTSKLDVQLPVDTDAPFLARGRGLHVQPPATGPTARTQAIVQSPNVRFRMKNAEGDHLAQSPIQVPADFWTAYGQGGNYRPIYPQQPYPPGGVIQFDVFNDGVVDFTNLQVIFRGVKLFRDGALPNPTYPTTCRALEFAYQSGKGTLLDPTLVLATTDTRRNNTFQVLSDADFALRGAQAGVWSFDGGAVYSPFGYTELYVQLFDANRKPYSNLPIHIDWLFGNGGGPLQVNNFTALGNAAPGLLFPEIYIPKNHFIYFDLYRKDAPYVAGTDALPVRIVIAWVGSKVYGQ